MKSFAKGTKKRLLGRGTSKKAKKQPSDEQEDTFGDIFGDSLTGATLEEPGQASGPLVHAPSKQDVEPPPSTQRASEASYDGAHTMGMNRRVSGSSVGSNPSFGAGGAGGQQQVNGITIPQIQRRTGRLRPTIGGTRPALSPSEVGLGFEQPAETEPQDSSDQVRRLQREADEWKSKYFALRDEFATLTDDYNKLLQEKGGPSREQIEDLQRLVQQKDEEIRRLRMELQAARSSAAGAAAPGEESTALAEAKLKISEQNEEIQKLLEQRLTLESELSELRFNISKGLPSARGPGIISVGGGGFDQDRMINNLRTELKARDDTIQELQDELSATRMELNRAAEVMGLVADQMGAEESKKKKTWWGKTKTRKVDPTKLSAADIDAVKRDASVVAGVSPEAEEPQRGRALSTVSGERIRSPSPAPMIAAGDLAGTLMNKRLLELERENARLEGEIDILQREKAVLDDRTKQAEAQVDILQKTLKNQDANLKAISVAKSLVVPLPTEGGTEADRLRAVVQVQEAALQKLSLKAQQLEDTLETYARDYKDPRAQVGQAVATLRQEMSEKSAELSEVRQGKRALEDRLALLQAKQSACEAELDRVRQTLDQSRATAETASRELKQKADTYAVMVGNLMKQNGQLQEELSRCKREHAVSTTTYEGEVRALRNGRVERLAGEAPVQPVFPSPEKLVHLRQVPERRRPPSPEPREEAPPPVEEEEHIPSPPVIQEERPPSPTRSPPSLPLKEEEVSPGAPSGSVFRYYWGGSSEGYVLRPEQPTPPEGGVRPVVTVEHHPPVVTGPFPPETTSPFVQDLHVDTADQVFAQSALRDWLRQHPPTTKAPPRPKTVLPTFPQERVARPVAPRPLREPPRVERTPGPTEESLKALLEEEEPPSLPSAEMLSFGRPSSGLPHSLGTFPPREEPVIMRPKEPRHDIAPPPSVSPPSLSHPLLGGGELEQERFQPVSRFDLFPPPPQLPTPAPRLGGAPSPRPSAKEEKFPPLKKKPTPGATPRPTAPVVAPPVQPSPLAAPAWPEPEKKPPSLPTDRVLGVEDETPIGRRWREELEAEEEAFPSRTRWLETNDVLINDLPTIPTTLASARTQLPPPAAGRISFDSDFTPLGVTTATPSEESPPAPARPPTARGGGGHGIPSARPPVQVKETTSPRPSVEEARPPLLSDRRAHQQPPPAKPPPVAVASTPREIEKTPKPLVGPVAIIPSKEVPALSPKDEGEQRPQPKKQGSPPPKLAEEDVKQLGAAAEMFGFRGGIADIDRIFDASEEDASPTPRGVPMQQQSSSLSSMKISRDEGRSVAPRPEKENDNAKLAQDLSREFQQKEGGPPRQVVPKFTFGPEEKKTLVG